MYRIHDMRSIALLCDESIDSYKNKMKMYKMTVYEILQYMKVQYMRSIAQLCDDSIKLQEQEVKYIVHESI